MASPDQRRPCWPLSLCALRPDWYREWRLRAVALFLMLWSALPAIGAEIPAEALRTVTRATVLIVATYKACDPAGPNDQLGTSGSGFIVADEGLIVTNAHVVDAYSVLDVSTGKRATSESDPANRKLYHLHSVTVRTHSGQPESRVYPGQVLCTHALPTDLALLRIRANEKLTVVPLASAAEFAQLKSQDSVWAIGFPLGPDLEAGLSATGLGKNPHGADISIRNGRLTALRRDGRGVKVLEHNCNIEHGNSGGPLVDARGRVVGVNYLGLGDRSMFAIPVNEVLRVFARTLRDRAGLGGRKRPPKVIKVTTVDELYAATANAGPGDTIDVAAGTYSLRANVADSELKIQRGVWLRGAGIGKTTFVERDASCGLVIGGVIMSPDGAELSDLTIVREATDAELVAPAVITTGNAEVFLHDVTIETRAAKGRCIKVVGESAVFNCTLLVNVKGTDNISAIAAEVLEGRFERVRLPSLSAARGSGDIRIRGCEFTRSDTPRISVAETAFPMVEGCVFDDRAVDLAVWPVVLLDDRSLGSFSDNLFWLHGTGGGIKLFRPQQVSFRSNRFEWRAERPKNGVGLRDGRFQFLPPYGEFLPVTVLRVWGAAKNVELERNAFLGCSAIHCTDDGGRADTGPIFSNGNGNRYVDDYKVKSD